MLAHMVQGSTLMGNIGGICSFLALLFVPMLVFGVILLWKAPSLLEKRLKSKESESTVTKDGSITTPGAVEQEITSTSLLAADNELVEKLEDALDNGELLDIWEANLDEPAEEGSNKFKGRYFQGYLTEFEKSSSAEDFVELSHTCAINGAGVRGDVTVSAEQQEMANYMFADTAKTGA